MSEGSPSPAETRVLYLGLSTFTGTSRVAQVEKRTECTLETLHDPDLSPRISENLESPSFRLDRRLRRRSLIFDGGPGSGRSTN